ncbi:MAG: penicillin-binding protein 1C [Magnetococcales bacterium]|nr:penicillin-binding protein 1C [Magnetococcales bacterium]
MAGGYTRWWRPGPAATDAAPLTFTQVREQFASSDAWLLDRHGAPLHLLRVNAQGRRLEWVPLEQISPAMIRMVLLAEDRRFFDHNGVAWSAVLGSLRDRVLSDIRRGASTVTMQLAGLLNPVLRPLRGRRDWPQKWSQMQAAWGLESAWSKNQILEAYLNLVTFRGELQGIGAASRSLFGKHPGGLSTSEALLLTALIPAPNGSAPRIAKRACTLARHHDPEIPCATLDEMAHRLLRGRLPAIRHPDNWAPHAARLLLEPLKESDITAIAPIRSTLDAPLQRLAGDLLNAQLQDLANHQVKNGAVLVADNASGEILAYVGGGDNHPSTRYVDGVRAVRQAGSTLKPFLYQLAIEQRLITPASLLDDSPVELTTPTGVYVPKNYDHTFKGWVSARTALASSLNVPAVRTLLLTGLPPFIQRLRQLGYDQLQREGEYYGYALALGSVEVSLWQQVAAYRTLAMGGKYIPLRLRADQPIPAEKPVSSAASAFLVADMLADPVARSITFGLHNPLGTPFWSSVKTGTSKQMRDNWCIGFSHRYTVGVWMGNFEGQPMRDVSGVSGSAQIWQGLMLHLHPPDDNQNPPLPLTPPAGVTQVTTTFHPPLEPPRQEWYLTGTEMGDIHLNDIASRPPRITEPADGSILALDPDIPPGHQRLFPRMEPLHPRHHWRMDGQPLDVSREGWTLTSGPHHLELLDEHDTIVSSSRFQVRGQETTQRGRARPRGGRIQAFPTRPADEGEANRPISSDPVSTNPEE